MNVSSANVPGLSGDSVTAAGQTEKGVKDSHQLVAAVQTRIWRLSNRLTFSSLPRPNTGETIWIDLFRPAAANCL